jgi:hypothetical protein
MQPSSAFTRNAWLEIGGINESIHIAMDVDYWLRIAKYPFKFITTSKLLSAAMKHDSAKTTSFKNHMVVDCSIVIIRHGGEQWVRTYLDDMASRLSYLEPNFTNVMRNRMVRMAKWLYSFTKKPLLLTIDTAPRWTAPRE